MSRGSTGKISASPRGNEAILRNRCSYQVPDIVGINDYTNKNHKFYNSTVQATSRGGGYCAKKVGALCASFVEMGAPVKIQVENGLSKLLDLLGQTIDTSDQSDFTLKDKGLHDEEGKNINTSEPITAAQRRPGNFVLFMMTVRPYHAVPNCKYSRMTCRSCVQLLLNVNGIDTSINTHMVKLPHDLIVYLEDLENGRNPDIGTLKKEKGEIFSECYTESFKAKLLR